VVRSEYHLKGTGKKKNRRSAAGPDTKGGEKEEGRLCYINSVSKGVLIRGIYQGAKRGGGKGISRNTNKPNSESLHNKNNKSICPSPDVKVEAHPSSGSQKGELHLSIKFPRSRESFGGLENLGKRKKQKGNSDRIPAKEKWKARITKKGEKKETS